MVSGMLLSRDDLLDGLHGENLRENIRILAELATYAAKLIHVGIDLLNMLDENLEEHLTLVGREVRVFEVIEGEADNTKRIVDFVHQIAERCIEMLETMAEDIVVLQLLLHFRLLKKALKRPDKERSVHLGDVQHVVNSGLLEVLGKLRFTLPRQHEDGRLDAADTELGGHVRDHPQRRFFAEEHDIDIVIDTVNGALRRFGADERDDESHRLCVEEFLLKQLLHRILGVDKKYANGLHRKLVERDVRLHVEFGAGGHSEDAVDEKKAVRVNSIPA